MPIKFKTDEKNVIIREGSVNKNMVKQLERQCKNTKIYFRIVPVVKMCWEHIKIMDDKKTIFLRYLQDFGIGKEMCKPSYWSFETDGVFYNNTQTEMYESIVPDLMQNVLKGQNAVILCFGQTGTGKSLTSLGIENSYEDRGIIPRLISDLFIIKDESKSKFKMTFNISYIESTKTHIRDLLKKEETILDINSLKRISSEKYSNEREMLRAIFIAEGRKTLTRTSKYRSNAANSVLSISITSRQVHDSSLIKTFSKIHVVDLAGADNFGNESSLDKNIFEVGTANLAKSQLEQFLLALVENVPEHIVVKQRLNILINYLKDSLNANSMLRFIGHIRTDKKDLIITLSMLRFGQILRGLKIRKLNYNSYEDEEMKIKNLQMKLKELKMEKEIESMIRNEDLRTNLTPERISHIKNVAQAYLLNKMDVVTILSVVDINTILAVFKNMFNNLENKKVIELENAYKKAYDDAVSAMKNCSRSIGSQRNMPGKHLASQTQELVVNLLQYFEEKKCNRGPLLSIDSVYESSRKNNQSKESLQQNPRQQKNSRKSLPKRSSSKVSSKSIEKNRSTTGTRLDNMNKAKSKDSLVTEKSLKRSKTSSKMLRKSISSKRKSSFTSDNQRERILDEDFILPDNIPSYREAWNSFVVNETYHYDEISNQMQEYEGEAKRLNHQYVDEIKKLQELRNRQDDCQNKLWQIQTQRELCGNKDVNEDGEPYVCESEAACMEILNGCQKQIIQQQEKVLSIQAELHLHLQLYQEKKKTINENFEAFCKENYKTLVPKIEDTIEENLPKIYSGYNDPDEEFSKQEQLESARKDAQAKECHKLFLQYEKFKSLTYKQHEKMLHDNLLNKKWIRSCKK